MRRISAQDAQEFGRVWTANGVAIPMKDIYYQFAADFANVAVQSFIEEAQRQQAAVRAMQEKLKPQIVMEGVTQ